MPVMVWVLIFSPFGDDRPPFVIHSYATQAECENVLDSIVRAGLAMESEVECVKRERHK